MKGLCSASGSGKRRAVREDHMVTSRSRSLGKVKPVGATDERIFLDDLDYHQSGGEEEDLSCIASA